jgi:hypothetical protein
MFHLRPSATLIEFLKEDSSLVACSRYTEVSIVVTRCTETWLETILLACALLTYRQTLRLDLRRAPSVSSLDRILLFICIPAYFFNAILSVPPYIATGDHLSLATTILQVSPLVYPVDNFQLYRLGIENFGFQASKAFRAHRV